MSLKGSEQVMIIENDDPSLDIVLAKFDKVNRILFGPDSVGDESANVFDPVDQAGEERDGRRLSNVNGFMEPETKNSDGSVWGFNETGPSGDIGI